MLSKFRTFWRKKTGGIMRGRVVLYPEATIVNMRRAECIRIGAFTHVRGELLTFAHGGEIRIGKLICYIGEHCKLWSAVIFMLAIVC